MKRKPGRAEDRAAKSRSSLRPAKEAAGPRSAPVAGALSGDGLALPHERDESTEGVSPTPDPVMVQAHQDIQAGLVDTDMRATAGLDAERRARLVPGAGGKPPGKAS